MKTYTFNGYKISLSKEEYRNNGTLAIVANYTNGDYDVLTTNLGSFMQTEEMAFLDTNNHPGLEKFIEKNSLGVPTGFTERSGFCTYPLYLIHIDKL